MFTWSGGLYLSSGTLQQMKIRKQFRLTLIYKIEYCKIEYYKKNIVTLEGLCNVKSMSLCSVGGGGYKYQVKNIIES